MNNEPNTPQPQELDPVKPELNTLTHLKPRPFRRLVSTIGNLPTVFVESLSLTEMLAYIQSYLENTVIPTVNDNAEAVKELQTFVVTTMNKIITEMNNFEDQVNQGNEAFRQTMTEQQEAFEARVQSANETFQTNLTQQQTTFENKIDGNIETLQAQFAALKEYCENYLQNLDYQSIIESKFDELVADGTIENLINAKIPINVVRNYNLLQTFLNNVNGGGAWQFQDTEYVYLGGIDHIGENPGMFLPATKTPSTQFDGLNSIEVPGKSWYLKRIDPISNSAQKKYAILYDISNSQYIWLTDTENKLAQDGSAVVSSGNNTLTFNVSTGSNTYANAAETLLANNPDITDFIIPASISTTDLTGLYNNMVTQIQTIRTIKPDVKIWIGYIPRATSLLNSSVRKQRPAVIQTIRNVCKDTSCLYLENVPYGYSDKASAAAPTSAGDTIAQNIYDSLHGIEFYQTFNMPLSLPAYATSAPTLWGEQHGGLITLSLLGNAIGTVPSGKTFAYTLPDNSPLYGVDAVESSFHAGILQNDDRAAASCAITQGELKIMEGITGARLDVNFNDKITLPVLQF